MTQTLDRLSRKLAGARQLGSVVHAMKSLAMLSIGQYENAVRALDDYTRTVELGLAACLRHRPEPEETAGNGGAIVVVLGSDQGLVGRFNEVVADRAANHLKEAGTATELWVVGERLAERLADDGFAVGRVMPVPGAVTAIAASVMQLLTAMQEREIAGSPPVVDVIFNRPTAGTSYEPVRQRLLPLDGLWQRRFSQMQWPTRNRPQPLGPIEVTLRAHVREYLFVSLYRACAESSCAENASRLAAMQRAERNIGSLIEELGASFNALRQGAIDEELFDVIAGFELVRSTG